MSSAPSAIPSSFLRDRQAQSISASHGLRWDSFLARPCVFTTFNRFKPTFMTDSSFLMSVFFNNLRFTRSSGGGTSVIGRFGDFVISRLFMNAFSQVSVSVSSARARRRSCVGLRKRILLYVMIRDSSSSPSMSFASSSWFSCSCSSDTARGSAASSVVVDLGFCGVSMTDLRFSAD